MLVLGQGSREQFPPSISLRRKDEAAALGH